MVEPEAEKKEKDTSYKTRWTLLVGALIAILIAVALAYAIKSPNLSHFAPADKSCRCAQVLLRIQISILILLFCLFFDFSCSQNSHFMNFLLKMIGLDE